MTGPDDEFPEPVPDFDDPAYDDVRALLAEARFAEPIPDHVAARLDAALAGLSTDTTVVPLRRRSRVATRLLAAAAAVVILGAGGVGLAKIVGNQNSSSDASASKASDSAGTGGTGSGTAPEAASGTTSEQDRANSLNLSMSALPKLKSTTFTADATRVIALRIAPVRTGTKAGGTASDSVTTVPGATATPAPAPASTPNSRAPASAYAQLLDSVGCTGSTIPGTTSYPVLLDGRTAVLVVYPATDGKRLVEARTCDGRTVLATTSVPG